MEKHSCSFCQKEFQSGPQLGSHIRVHTRALVTCNLCEKRVGENRLKKHQVICTEREKLSHKICGKCGKQFVSYHNSFCSRICANSHIITDEHKKKTSAKMMGRVVTQRVAKKCYICFCDFEIKSSSRRQYCYNAECTKKNRASSISKALKGKSGGLRKGGGRGKHGWYKGFWCDSSWELAWVIYSLENNIKFQRNKQGFEYDYEGETRKYYPDFVLEDGTYIEIKGYYTDRYKEKQRQFPHPLKVLTKKDMKVFLDFATQKYGKDIVELYDSE